METNIRINQGLVYSRFEQLGRELNTLPLLLPQNFFTFLSGTVKFSNA